MSVVSVTVLLPSGLVTIIFVVTVTVPSALLVRVISLTGSSPVVAIPGLSGYAAGGGNELPLASFTSLGMAQKAKPVKNHKIPVTMQIQAVDPYEQPSPQVLEFLIICVDERNG